MPTQITRTTSMETNKRVLLDQVYDRSSLSPEMQEMCAGHEIHSVEEIGGEPEAEEWEPGMLQLAIFLNNCISNSEHFVNHFKVWAEYS